jgi:hypothetical protein
MSKRKHTSRSKRVLEIDFVSPLQLEECVYRINTFRPVQPESGTYFKVEHENSDQVQVGLTHFGDKRKYVSGHATLRRWQGTETRVQASVVYFDKLSNFTGCTYLGILYIAFLATTSISYALMNLTTLDFNNMPVASAMLWFLVWAVMYWLIYKQLNRLMDSQLRSVLASFQKLLTMPSYNASDTKRKYAPSVFTPKDSPHET